MIHTMVYGKALPMILQNGNLGQSIINKHKLWDTYDLGSVALVFLEESEPQAPPVPMGSGDLQMIVRLLLQFNQFSTEKKEQYHSLILYKQYLEQTVENYMASLYQSRDPAYQRLAKLKKEMETLKREQSLIAQGTGRQHRQKSYKLRRRQDELSKSLMEELLQSEKPIERSLESKTPRSRRKEPTLGIAGTWMKPSEQGSSGTGSPVHKPTVFYTQFQKSQMERNRLIEIRTRQSENLQTQILQDRSTREQVFHSSTLEWRTGQSRILQSEILQKNKGENQIGKTEMQQNQTWENRMWETETRGNRTLHHRIAETETKKTEILENRISKMETEFNRTLHHSMAETEFEKNQTLENRITKTEIRQNQTLKNQIAETKFNRTFHHAMAETESEKNRTLENRITKTEIKQNQTLKNQIAETETESNRIVHHRTLQTETQQNRILENWMAEREKGQAQILQSRILKIEAETQRKQTLQNGHIKDGDTERTIKSLSLEQINKHKMVRNWETGQRADLLTDDKTERLINQRIDLRAPIGEDKANERLLQMTATNRLIRETATKITGQRTASLTFRMVDRSTAGPADYLTNQQAKTMIEQRIKTVTEQQTKTVVEQQIKTVTEQQTKSVVEQQIKTVTGQQTKSVVEQQAKTMIEQQAQTVVERQAQTLVGRQNQNTVKQQTKNRDGQQTEIMATSRTNAMINPILTNTMMNLWTKTVTHEWTQMTTERWRDRILQKSEAQKDKGSQGQNNIHLQAYPSAKREVNRLVRSGLVTRFTKVINEEKPHSLGLFSESPHLLRIGKSKDIYQRSGAKSDDSGQTAGNQSNASSKKSDGKSKPFLPLIHGWKGWIESERTNRRAPHGYPFSENTENRQVLVQMQRGNGGLQRFVSIGNPDTIHPREPGKTVRVLSGHHVFENRLFRVRSVHEQFIHTQQMKYNLEENQASAVEKATSVAMRKEQGQATMLQKQRREDGKELNYVKQVKDQGREELERQKRFVAELSNQVREQGEKLQSLSQKKEPLEKKESDNRRVQELVIKEKETKEFVKKVKKEVMDSLEKEMRLERQRRGL